MSISSQENVTLPESSLIKTILSLENTASSSFLIIFYFVTNQSGKNFNTGRLVSTTLSHISWVLQHSGKNCITEGEVSTALLHIFLSLIAIRDKF